MYLGRADWEVIGKAARVCDGSGVSFLGNGDVESMEDAALKAKTYGLDGVLVGRAALGRPWFFGGEEPDSEEGIMRILLEHCRYFVELDHLYFYNIKKHLAWYCKGFEGAKEMRMKLMRAGSLEDVEEILNDKHGKA